VRPLADAGGDFTDSRQADRVRDDLRSAYDEAPYESFCPPAGNLLPFAAANPGARAVGIDLSPAQIEHGRMRIRELGVDNIELVNQDIGRVDLAALG
jgi:tRNA/tmRNA/rRNA uracil-C5-methylase (TrmA/RlmC/RlmD family)